MSDIWIVAGLGNPGERYASTRHNAGAMVVALLCERLGVRPRKVRFINVLAAEAKLRSTQALLTTPTTYMNLSGPPLASFAKKREVPVERVVAVHDELDLPFGAIRIKRGGSTAGHHGLDSLVEAFRSKDFHRVRVGIGRPQGRQAPMDFVLRPYPSQEREHLGVQLEEAADAVETLVTEGLEAAQQRHTRPGFR